MTDARQITAQDIAQLRHERVWTKGDQFTIHTAWLDRLLTLAAAGLDAQAAVEKAERHGREAGLLEGSAIARRQAWSHVGIGGPELNSQRIADAIEKRIADEDFSVADRERPIRAFPEPKGRRYLVEDSDGNWHYLNHAGMWCGCPPPHRDDVARARAEERAACRAAVGFAAWRHEGDDARSAGMDEGARHQVQECVKAIDALGPTSDAIASVRAAVIEECARNLEAEAIAIVTGSWKGLDYLTKRVIAETLNEQAASIRALAKKEG